MKRMLICAAVLLQGCTYNVTWGVEQSNPRPNPQAGTFKLSYSYFSTRLFGKPVQGDWAEYWAASRQCRRWGYTVTPGAVDADRVPNATRVDGPTRRCGYSPNGGCTIWYVSSHWRCVKG